MRIFINLTIAFLLSPIASFAEIILVNQVQGGFWVSPAPTVTYVYRSQDPQRTVLYINGGDGKVGVKPDWDNHKYFTEYSFNMFFKRFTESDKTSGSSNVVVFDNPTSLDQGDSYYPHPRGNTDHLIRVHSVVQHYAKLFNKPVWILGHSNGSASAAEYLTWLEKQKKDIDIKGVIYASGANGTKFPQGTKVPVMFVHHEKEGCVKYVTEAYSRGVYEKLKAEGNTKTEYFLASGGTPDPKYKNPCWGGHHTYFGAEEQVSKAIDEFLIKYSE